MNLTACLWGYGNKKGEQMSGKIEPYKGSYTHRVLPLVYDDALSHIETLARFSYKLNEVIDMCNNISDNIISEVNAYTDKKVAETFAKIDEAVNEIYVLKGELDKEYREFSKLTNAQLQMFNQRLEAIGYRIDDTIIAINERTDLAIEQNNERIFGELGKSLSRIKVLNYFTGGYVSVQEMLDYLSLLHVENAFIYELLIAKNISYTELASRNVRFTDLVLDGSELI